MSSRNDSRGGRAIAVLLGACVIAAWTGLVGPAAAIAEPPEGAGLNADDAPVVLSPEALTWTEREGGVRVAVLYGDQNQPGPFVLRLQYPAGYRKGPHYHPGDAQVTVLSGSYFRGYGHRVDETQAFRLTPGTFSVNPAASRTMSGPSNPRCWRCMLRVRGARSMSTTREIRAEC